MVCGINQLMPSLSESRIVLITGYLITLREGKNREIRRVMEALNLQVNRLIRIGYGPFELGKMPRGAVQEVEAKVMKAQIKKYFGGS